MAACDCAACGRKFSSLTAFDRHHELDYARRPAVRCLDPESAGLVLNRHGRWAMPGKRPFPSSDGENAAL
jgi:hypothetical protein